jgi:hypothetical protein
MCKKKNIGLICSLLLHIGILFYIVFPEVPMPPPINKSKSLMVRLIPNEKIQKNLKTLKENTKPDFKSYPSDITICAGEDKNYKGIGITFAVQIIKYAPEYYPAYKAGIRVGDQILYLKEFDDFIDIAIARGYNRLYFHIKKDNICYNDK